MKNIKKEQIEHYLLCAMKNLDLVIKEIWVDSELYAADIVVMQECKHQIKRILNAKFDALARQNEKYKNMNLYKKDNETKI